MPFYFVILLFFSINISWAEDCPRGSYYVKDHERSSYHRGDGTYVSETNVKSTCREYRAVKKLKIKFNNQLPTEWPHKYERVRKWTQLEQRQLTSIIGKLQKALTQIGELRIIRAEKSTYSGNPAATLPSEKIIIIYNKYLHIKWRELSLMN